MDGNAPDAAAAEAVAAAAARAGSPPASGFADPPLACDVVMKGGITSGIVYPRAITELASRYRFVNVGGSSAGAIAAAAAAAAEHGREASGGASFARLWELPDEVAAPGTAGPTAIFDLFLPDPATRDAFELASSLVVARKVPWPLLRRRLAAVGVRSPLPWAAGFALLTLALAGLTAAGVLAVWPGLFGIALALVATAVAALATAAFAVAAFARESVAAIEANTFGLCRLGPIEDAPADAVPTDRPLTMWLHGLLRGLAGLDDPEGRPLTFGDLWTAPRAGESPEEREARARRAPWDAEARTVHLELMTTDLGRGRAVRLPVPLSRHEPHPSVEPLDLLFERAELARFFPPPVLAHLCAEKRRVPDETQEVLRRAHGGRGEWYELPLGAELPVVVAVRLSLSFPILISAVPLWRVQRHPATGELLAQRIVFSDGGITSNFPIHFFDGILPRRPTFAVNLVGYDERRHRADGGEPPPERFVVPPASGRNQLPEIAREIHGVGGFLVALKDAMQNWHDNGQQRLPGFRDRIVGVELRASEGGLNLNMDGELVRSLGRRGAAAGALLRTLFAPGPEPQARDYWNTHRWTRYRTAVALLGPLLRRCGETYDDAGDGISVGYAQLLSEGLTEPWGWPSADARAAAEQVTRDIVAVRRGWAGPPPVELDDPNVPAPSPDLRIVPRG